MTTLQSATGTLVRRTAILVCLPFTPLVAQVTQAGATRTASAPAQTIPVMMRVRAVDQSTAAIGRRILVEVDSVRDAIHKDKLDSRKFVLYLNGHALWNVRSEPVNLQRNRLEFLLERADTSRNAWVALLGQPKAFNLPNVRVGVGYDSSPELDAIDKVNPPVISLRVLGGWRLAGGFGVIVAAVALFFGLATKSTIIRDSTPPNPPAGKNRPYSLARLQMAFWFFLVFAAFGFLWAITGSFDVLNAQALTLIGIGTGTALGAAAVDAGKRQTAVDDLATLEPQLGAKQAELDQVRVRIGELDAVQAPLPDKQAEERKKLATLSGEREAELVQIHRKITDAKATESRPHSEGFFKDILTDASGVSFHRFQILSWTIVLGFIFVAGVYERLAMPEFNPTLLALMGISSGTYLGFKIPEKQG